MVLKMNSNEIQELKAFSDGVNENLEDTSNNADFVSEQDLYTDLVKTYTEERDYEKVRIADLIPGKNLEEKVKIYLDKAQVKHFRRRQYLLNILRGYWNDEARLKDGDYKAHEYNRELLKLLQAADLRFYPTRESEKKKFPQKRDPGYGWDARTLWKNIIRDLHIVSDPDMTKEEKVIKLINKLQNKTTEADLSDKEKVALKKHSAATYLKIGGKPFLKEYLEPPPEIARSIKKIGEELRISKTGVLDLISRLETTAKEKKLSERQKQVLAKHAAGRYLRDYLKINSLTRYVGFPKEISNIIENLKKDLKKSEDKVIPLINKLRDRETEHELTSKEKEILRRNAAGKYLRYMTGVVPVGGYEGLPKEISLSLNKVQTALKIPMHEVYKLIEKLEKESSAKKLPSDVQGILKEFNAGRYLDFIGKPVALSFRGLPEEMAKNLIEAQKTLKITNQEEFFRLVDQLQQKNTEQELTSHQKEIFKRYAVGNYLKHTRKNVVAGYTGLPEDIQSSINNVRKALQLSKSDTFKLIKKLGSEAKAKELTPTQREILRHNAAGRYLEYIGEWVVPGFSGFMKEKFNPYKMFEGITRDLRITPGEAIDLVYMLEKKSLEKRLTSEQKTALRRYGAGRYLTMLSLPVVQGYVGLPFEKEMDITAMIKGISHDLNITQQTVFELLDSLGNAEKVRQLRPETRRILKKWKAGSFRRMLGKKVVTGFDENSKEDEDSTELVPKNVIPQGNYYHPSVGWY